MFLLHFMFMGSTATSSVTHWISKNRQINHPIILW